MKKQKIIIQRYGLICPICKRKITGNSESATQYNLRVHKERKHFFPKEESNEIMLKEIKEELK